MIRTIFKRFSVLFVLVSLSTACATDYQNNVEKARFELDKGNFTTAINAATSAIQANPGDIEATRLLASAYLGRSGISFLDLAQGLFDLQNSTETNFRAIANVLPSSATLSDLRSAITTLETLTGVDNTSFTDESLADAVFDLAIMQMVEHFAVGVYNSNFFSTLDVSLISDGARINVQNDLLNFDNRLIASGVDSTESFISEVRQTWCILSPLSAGDGFTVSEYRALVACQLAADSTTVNTVAIDPNIANCAALAPNTADPCLSQDTSL